MMIKEVEIGDHIFTDDGGGITQRTLEYFDTLKGNLGRIIEIHIDSDRNFCWEIFCDATCDIMVAKPCAYICNVTKSHRNNS